MSIQPIGNNNQIQMNSMRSDLQNFSTKANALQSALSSGNQDQVTISQNAMAASLSQLVSDVSGNSQVQSSYGSRGQTNPMQTLQNDLQTLQSALSSVSSGQGTSSSYSSSTGATSALNTALNNVMNDISAMQQGHGHHHHHHGSGGGGSYSSSQSQNPMQTLLNDLTNLQQTLTSSGTQSQNTTTSINNVMNVISSFMTGPVAGANNGNTVNITT